MLKTAHVDKEIAYRASAILGSLLWGSLGGGRDGEGGGGDGVGGVRGWGHPEVAAFWPSDLEKAATEARGSEVTARLVLDSGLAIQGVGRAAGNLRAPRGVGVRCGAKSTGCRISTDSGVENRSGPERYPY